MRSPPVETPTVLMLRRERAHSHAQSARSTGQPGALPRVPASAKYVGKGQVLPKGMDRWLPPTEVVERRNKPLKHPLASESRACGTGFIETETTDGQRTQEAR